MRMKIMAAALLAAGISVSVAQAATDGGGGNLTISGSIVQPPCSIHPSSVDQLVELGAVSSSTINGGKVGRKVPFEIKLQDCDAPSTVRVSIWGVEDSLDSTLLHLGSGTATGAGIAFFDSTESQIKLGENSRDIQVPSGDFTLALSAALKGNSTDSVAEPGPFSSTATFKLEYN